MAYLGSERFHAQVAAAASHAVTLTIPAGTETVLVAAFRGYQEVAGTPVQRVVTGATIGASAMTLQGAAATPVNNLGASLLSLSSPPTGAQTLTVTWDGTFGRYEIVAIYDDGDGALSNFAGKVVDSGNATVTIPSVDGHRVLAVFLARAGGTAPTIVAGAGESVLADYGTATAWGANAVLSVLEQAGAASVAIAPTISGGTEPYSAVLAISFAASAGPPPPPGPSGTLPTGWAAIGAPTTTISTDPLRTRFGGQSVRVQTTVEGHGIQTPAATLSLTAARPYVSYYLTFWLAAGQVRAEMVATDGVTTWVIPDGIEGRAISNERDTWVELGMAGIDLFALGATSCYLRLVQDGTTPVDVYVDAAQLTQSAGHEPLIEGSGATALWQEANRQLVARSQPLVQYDIEVLDLAAVDATLWGSLAVQPGDQIRIVDPDLPVAGTTRTIEIDRDELQDANVRLVLSSRPEDLTDAIVRPRPAPRKPRDPVTDTEIRLEAFFSAVQGSDDQVGVRLEARPALATVYYAVRDVGEDTPVIGSNAYTAYTGALTIDRRQDADLKLCAYASLGTRFSSVHTWAIPKQSGSGVTVGITEPVAGRARVAWEPGSGTVAVRLYLRVNGAGAGWPTTTGDQTAPVDPASLIGTIQVARDAGAVDATGAALAGMIDETGASVSGIGGTTWQSTATYSAGQVVRVLLVPIDATGRPGTRAFAARTMTGAVAAALTSWSQGALTDVSGGALGNGEATYANVAWVCSAAITNPTHDLALWTRRDGGDWVFRQTVASPAPSGTARIPVGATYSTSKYAPVAAFDVLLELFDGGGYVAAWVTNAMTAPVSLAE